jgi:hypothetical protein
MLKRHIDRRQYCPFILIIMSPSSSSAEPGIGDGDGDSSSIGDCSFVIYFILFF